MGDHFDHHVDTVLYAGKRSVQHGLNIIHALAYKSGTTATLHFVE